MLREDLRNIAIIAHVDHGKTTLVDEMLRQGGAFRENQVVNERVMDSGDIERERGITILSKNTSANYKGVKINIVDTPGHADFGGEVERVLKMVNGVLLLVDAFEGPMPQTRFVLKKALELNHKVIIAVGRIDGGVLRQGMEVQLCDYHDADFTKKAKITAIYQFEGLNRVEAKEARAGDIVSFSGIEDVAIGNTVCEPEHLEPIPFVKISEPTVEMTFSVNDSPFAGREGKFVTSRHVRDRLMRELQKDVSLRVEETETPDAFRVMGRGEMHLSILIENMRREGYEMQVSTPKVLYKTIDGVLNEPIERLVADVPENCVGSVIEKLGTRKSELVHMSPNGSRMRLEFLVPARGLFGYRSEFLTDTKGEGVLNTIFHGYAPYKGDIPRRALGSLIAFETGEAVTYGLYNAQERGVLFLGAGTEVYGGMVVGYSPKSDDIVVNVCKKKHVTNIRASGSDEALRLTPPKIMSLEETLEFISDDELVEVTPKSIRIRKRILDHQKRLRANAKK